MAHHSCAGSVARGCRASPVRRWCATSASVPGNSCTSTPRSSAASGTSASVSAATACSAARAPAGSTCTWPSTITPASRAEVLPSDRRSAAVAFLERALRWYAAQGITVEAVMTDNGSAYRSRAWLERCTQLGLRHLRTRPYTPRTNGKAERFIQTLLRGWAYGFAYPSSQHRTRALSGWLRWSTDAGPTARSVVSRPSAVSHRSVVTTARRRSPAPGAPPPPRPRS